MAVAKLKKPSNRAMLNYINIDIKNHVKKIENAVYRKNKANIITSFCLKYRDRPMAIELFRLTLIDYKIDHPMFSFSTIDKKVTFNELVGREFLKAYNL